MVVFQVPTAYRYYAVDQGVRDVRNLSCPLNSQFRKQNEAANEQMLLIWPGKCHGEERGVRVLGGNAGDTPIWEDFLKETTVLVFLKKKLFYVNIILKDV